MLFLKKKSTITRPEGWPTLSGVDNKWKNMRDMYVSLY